MGHLEVRETVSDAINNNNNLLLIRRKYLCEYIQMRLTSYIVKARDMFGRKSKIEF